MSSFSSGSYKGALAEAMSLLADRPEVVFVGQGIRFPGTAGYDTLAHIPDDRKIEFPVAENLQVGACTGLALAGLLPVCYVPRWNFLLLAADQLVNHLDRLPLYSGYRPKVILRTAVGRNRPLDPGPQHADDFTNAFRLMLRTVDVFRPTTPQGVLDAYRFALGSERSTLVVEDGNSC
jgi:pyruvate/2-oxoglutarate/acetoin dehydrogenase E1 component